MFDRFTNRALKAVTAASLAAQTAGRAAARPTELLIAVAETPGPIVPIALETNRTRIASVSLGYDRPLNLTRGAPDEKLDRDVLGALMLACEEVSRFRDNWIDSEHLVLGILRRCTEIAHALGESINTLRDRIAVIRRSSPSYDLLVDQPPRWGDHVDYSLCRALTRAYAEAQSYGDRGIEHVDILIGILSDRDNGTTKTLARLRVPISESIAILRSIRKRGMAQSSSLNAEARCLDRHREDWRDLVKDASRSIICCAIDNLHLGNIQLLGTTHVLIGVLNEDAALRSVLLDRYGLTIQAFQVQINQDAASEGDSDVES